MVKLYKEADLKYYFFCLMLAGAVNNASSQVTVSYQPQNKSICAGNNAFFKAGATAGCGLTYQWQVKTGGTWSTLSNGGVYTGANADTLKLASAGSSLNNSYYRCLINGSCGNATSDSARLYIKSAPDIYLEPKDTFSGLYSGIQVIVAASGDSLNYLWIPSGYNGYAVSGTNNDTALVSVGWNQLAGTLPAATVLMRCIISNSCGADTSRSATIYPNTWRWNGSVSSAWTNAANWDWGSAPPDLNTTATSGMPPCNVLIPSNAVRSPVFSGSYSFTQLRIDSGSTFSMANRTDLVSIFQTILAKGTYDGSVGTTMYGNEAYGITGSTYRKLITTAWPFAWSEGNIVVKDTFVCCNSMVGFEINSGNTFTIDTNAYIHPSASFIMYAYSSPVNTRSKLRIRALGSGGRTGSIYLPIFSGGYHSGSTAHLNMNNTGTADDFTISMIDSVTNGFGGSVPYGPKITGNIVKKLWLIEEGVSGGSNISLTLSWTSGDELTGFNRSNCYISHYTPTGWNHGSGAAASSSNGIYSLSQSGFTSVGPFAVGSNGALPLKILYFKARSANEKIKLEWETASEFNIAHYEILRSENGKDYTALSKVLVPGNTSQLSRYNIDDEEGYKLLARSGMLYYRLIQVDLDGNESIVGEEIIKSEKRNNYPQVFPNPFTESPIIVANQTGQLHITVFDISGRLQFEEDMVIDAANQSQQLDKFQNLKQGVYFLWMEMKGEKYVLKVVKKR